MGRQMSLLYHNMIIVLILLIINDGSESALLSCFGIKSCHINFIYKHFYEQNYKVLDSEHITEKLGSDGFCVFVRNVLRGGASGQIRKFHHSKLYYNTWCAWILMSFIAKWFLRGPAHSFTWLDRSFFDLLPAAAPLRWKWLMKRCLPLKSRPVWSSLITFQIYADEYD